MKLAQLTSTKFETLPETAISLFVPQKQLRGMRQILDPEPFGCEFFGLKFSGSRVRADDRPPGFRGCKFFGVENFVGFLGTKFSGSECSILFRTLAKSINKIETKGKDDDEEKCKNGYEQWVRDNAQFLKTANNRIFAQGSGGGGAHEAEGPENLNTNFLTPNTG